MSKYPIPQNEQERLKALDNYQILDTLTEKDFDRITELASLICDVPISLVSLVDEKRQWFKSSVGLDVKETSRDLAFCQYAIMEPDMFVVPDATKDERFRQNDLVTSKPDIRFYAGYPLVDPGGYALGTLCVIDRTPRELSKKQTRALELLGQEVIALIVDRKQRRELRSFQKLFDFSNDLLFEGGLDGYFKKVNPAFTKVLGWSEEELLNTSSFKFYHPDDIKATENELKNLGEGQNTINFEQRFKTPDGSYKTIEWTSTPDPFTGNIFGIGRDITEIKIKEQKLAFSEQMLEQTNKVARVGGWEFDVAQQKIYWTSVTKEIHGVTADYEPQLESSIDFYKAGKSRDRLAVAIKLAIEYGTPYDLELEIINMQGQALWIRSIGNAEMENGVCKRLFGIFQDINEKKKAELEIISSRKFLKDLLQAASEVSIVATDPQGVITVFNKGAEKILGYTAEEMIGKQTTEIFRSPEEMAQRKIEVSEELGYEVDGFRIITEKPDLMGSEQREWTVIKKNGEKIMISSVVSPIRDDKNTILGYVSIATDITARKIAENALSIEKARLSAFVEHTPAAVAMLDKNMHFIAISNKWLEDYSLTGRQIIGASYYDIFAGLDEERKGRHQRVLAGAIEKKEEEIYRLAGSEVDEYARWEMRPWFQFNGDIGGIMIFTQNITDIIKQREEFKAAKLMAEQASIAKSEFLANMSHEIRTPLNGVIGFTDLVLKTKLNETQQQYLSIVNQSANALLNIINDILDFSKIEAGKLELDVEKCDLYEIGSQATDIITYQIQKKGLEMLLNISPGLPRFIWADSVRLKQVLINLLGNASKFTEKGEIELKIEALAVKGGHTVIRFGVRDTGIGIKPEKQEKIFEAFSREDSSTTKKYGGTGLGLTISNKLLGLMGSRLQLQSTPGIGSTFYFDLTLKTEKGEPIDWANINLIKKVLVVDDNDNNRLILKQMLLLKNIHSIEAKNGLETLQVLATGEQFDVILMDYHMPYMDGLETIKKIRESFYQTAEEQPVILLYSSSDDEKIIKDCDELKVSRRLVKPIKIQDIYDALSTLHIKSDLKPAPGKKDVESTQNPINILIVEDNPVNMLLAKFILERIAPNSVLREAANGLEGVNAFKEQIPDIIFMDVQMPEMNGYEATRAIRALETTDGHVPIIALTAGNVKSERERCIDAGMDDFVVKPVVEETIALVFNKWLYPVEGNIIGETIKANGDAVHFDKDALMELFGDEGILGEFLSLIEIELSQAVLKLQSCIESKNLRELITISHKLHGTSVSAGLNVLAKITAKLETMTAFHEDDIKALFEQAKAEIALVLKLIG